MMKRFDKLVRYYEALGTATTYTCDYLKHGSSCDSSTDAKEKMHYVNKALMSEEIKNHVLKIATEYCLNDIEALSDSLQEESNQCEKWLQDNK